MSIVSGLRLFNKFNFVKADFKQLDAYFSKKIAEKPVKAIPLDVISSRNFNPQNSYFDVFHSTILGHTSSAKVEFSEEVLDLHRKFGTKYYVDGDFLVFLVNPESLSKNRFLNFICNRLKKRSEKSKQAFLQNLEKYRTNFKPFKTPVITTTKDAIKYLKEHGFVKRIIGVDKKNPQDLEKLKILCEALTDIYNKTGGCSYMPANIFFSKKGVKSIDGYKTLASYSNILDALVIPKNMPLNKFTIYHEVGHANHSLFTDITKMLRHAELYELGKTNARVTTRFCKNEEIQKLIKENMREYSSVSPAEFVADYFAYMIQGKLLPEELSKVNEALLGFKSFV